MTLEIAIVGATGLVGLEMRKVIHEKYSKELQSKQIVLKLFASSARPDEGIFSLAESWEELSSCRYILNASSAEVAEELKNKKSAKQILIDNSSAFRMDPAVPLVVPEVNSEVLDSHEGIIANPNCTAIILCVALKPLVETGIQRVTVSTYQSASGAGIKGLDELESQMSAWTQPVETWKTEVFCYPLAGNVMSHNTEIRSEEVIGAGYNEEEWKVIEETRKILSQRSLYISATCMRVPVLRAHTESVTIDLKNELSLAALRKMYEHASGIKIVDDWNANHFPMPLEAQDQDLVLVGRIRKDCTLGRTIHLLIAGDQIRKGAATNAIQIMEVLLKNSV